MREINKKFIIFVFSLLFSGLSYSFCTEQVWGWGEPVSGSRVSGVAVGGAPFILDEEKFEKCLRKNEKKLEKAAGEKIPMELIKNTLADNIISAFSGGKVGKLVIGHAVKAEVMGVVPESWKDIGEAISDILTRCVKNSKKSSSSFFGGKRVTGEPVSGEPVSGADASKWSLQ